MRTNCAYMLNFYSDYSEIQKETYFSGLFFYYKIVISLHKAKDPDITNQANKQRCTELCEKISFTLPDKIPEANSSVNFLAEKQKAKIN